MSDAFRPCVGGIPSADIAVPEHEREVRFYSRVLCTGESPLWRENLMSNVGMPVVGLGVRSPDLAHLPLQWMPHIQVADVATSVSHALDGGGSELMHAKDNAGGSQWAVLLDPNGAAFGIIPVVSAVAGQQPDATGAGVGRIAWLDLTVADAVATRDFYRKVVGWTAQDVERVDDSGAYADFSMLAHDGVPAAGVCHARGANLGLPPVWLIHLPVGDLAESVRRVREEGGRVVHETRGINGEGGGAVIEDPVGAYFALVQALVGRE